jgi:cytochrome c oxidase subunit 2
MKKWIVFASILTLALVIAACGANSGGSNGGNSGDVVAVEAAVEPASEVVLTASDWKFDQQEYQIKAGEPVALTLKSVGGVHGVQILKTKHTIGNNESVTLQFDKPGTYDIICNVPCGGGHAKMKAKLVVT